MLICCYLSLQALASFFPHPGRSIVYREDCTRNLLTWDPSHRVDMLKGSVMGTLFLLLREWAVSAAAAADLFVMLPRDRPLIVADPFLAPGSFLLFPQNPVSNSLLVRLDDAAGVPDIDLKLCLLLLRSGAVFALCAAAASLFWDLSASCLTFFLANHSCCLSTTLRLGLPSSRLIAEESDSKDLRLPRRLFPSSPSSLLFEVKVVSNTNDCGVSSGPWAKCAS